MVLKETIKKKSSLIYVVFFQIHLTVMKILELRVQTESKKHVVKEKDEMKKRVIN